MTTLQRPAAPEAAAEAQPAPAAAPPWTSRRPVRWCSLVLGSTLTVLVMTATADLHRLRTTLPHNLGDPALVTWILAWQSHAVANDPGSWFDGNMFHPHGQALGYSELLLPLLPFFGAVYGATGNAVLAHNVVLLGALVLCLAATYVLARRLGVSPPSAYLAAVAFTFTSYTYAHLGHLQLLTMGSFPLGVLALDRLYDRRRLRDGLVVGAATAGLVTACLYYGVIWMTWLAVVAVLYVALDWRQRRTDGVGPGIAAVVATVVLLAPVGLVLLRFQSEVDFARPMSDLGALSASDLLTPAVGSYLYGPAATAAQSRFMPHEHTFFPGLLVLGLGVVGGGALAGGLRRVPAAWKGRADALAPRHVTWLVLAVGAVVAMSVAVGPTAFGLPAPFRLLFHVAPGYDSIRVPARLAVPALLFLALAAGRGADQLARVAGRAAVLVPVLALVVVVAELATPFRRVDARPSPTEAARYAAIAALPPGPVVELPAAGASSGIPGVFAESGRLLHSIGDWRPRFNGTSGGTPPGYLDQADVLNTFPDPAAVELARSLGLEHVVLIVGAEGDPFRFSAAEARRRIDAIPEGASAAPIPGGWVVHLDGAAGS